MRKLICFWCTTSLVTIDTQGKFLANRDILSQNLQRSAWKWEVRNLPERACVSNGVLLFGVNCPLVMSTVDETGKEKRKERSKREIESSLVTIGKQCHAVL